MFDLRRMYRHWLTRVPDFVANWKRRDETTIEDEFLGVFHHVGVTNDAYRGEIKVNNKSISLTFFDNLRIEETLLFARSIVAALPRMDSVYKRLAAQDYVEASGMFGPRQASKTEIRAAMAISRVEVHFPIAGENMGANLWYSCGKVFGGFRICVVLNSRRRLHSVNMG
jgi:hypothetical protein